MDKTTLRLLKEGRPGLLFGLKNIESYVRIVIDYRNLLESSDKDAF